MGGDGPLKKKKIGKYTQQKIRNRLFCYFLPFFFFLSFPFPEENGKEDNRASGEERRGGGDRHTIEQTR